MRWNPLLVTVFLLSGPGAYFVLTLMQPPKLAVFAVLFGMLFLLIVGRGVVAACQLFLS